MVKYWFWTFFSHVHVVFTNTKKSHTKRTRTHIANSWPAIEMETEQLAPLEIPKKKLKKEEEEKGNQKQTKIHEMTLLNHQLLEHSKWVSWTRFYWTWMHSKYHSTILLLFVFVRFSECGHLSCYQTSKITTSAAAATIYNSIIFVITQLIYMIMMRGKIIMVWSSLTENVICSEVFRIIIIIITVLICCECQRASILCCNARHLQKLNQSQTHTHTITVRRDRSNTAVPLCCVVIAIVFCWAHLRYVLVVQSNEFIPIIFDVYKFK